MRKALKSLIVFQMVMIVAVYPVFATTYTAAELSIDNIFPDVFCKTKPRPAGGWTTSSRILDIAVENTVYPPSNTSILKKIAPVALTAGRFAGWLALGVSTGYFLYDTVYLDWMNGRGLDYEDGEYYQPTGTGIEVLYGMGVTIDQGAINSSISTLASTYNCTTVVKIYCEDSNEAVALRDAQAAQSPFGGGTGGTTLSFTAPEGNYTVNLLYGVYTAVQKFYAYIYPGQNTGFGEEVTMGDPINMNDIYTWFDDDFMDGTVFDSSKFVADAVKEIQKEYNEYYSDDPVEPSTPARKQMIEALRPMLAAAMTNDDASPVDDADYTDVLQQALEAEPVYDAFVRAINDTGLSTGTGGTVGDYLTQNQITAAINNATVTGQTSLSREQLQAIAEGVGALNASALTQEALQGAVENAMAQNPNLTQQQMTQAVSDGVTQAGAGGQQLDPTTLQSSFQAALAAAGLDTTDDDKTTPEEITQGVDATDLAAFIQEEPTEQDMTFGESDLPPELQGQDAELPEGEAAYAWFQDKVAGIRTALASKVSAEFSGSCEITLDAGTFGAHQVSFCPYADTLAMMGNYFVLLTALAGLVSVLRS